MRKFIFTILIVLSIQGHVYAEEDFGWYSFDDTEKKVWIKAGFDKGDGDWADIFHRLGMKPKAALAEKKKWVAAIGDSAFSAEQWMQNEFSVAEAAAWYRAGMTSSGYSVFDNPLLCVEYRNRDFKPAEAKAWFDAVRDSFRASKWRAAGLTPQQARDMEQAGRRP